MTPEYVHNFEISWQQKKQSIALYYDWVTDAINGIYFLEDQIALYKYGFKNSVAAMGVALGDSSLSRLLGLTKNILYDDIYKIIVCE